MDSIKLSSTPEPQSLTNNVKLAILKQAKGVGRDIVQILGFGKPASLKSLSSRLEKLNQDIDDLKMAAPSLSKRKTKQFLKKLKLRTELSDKLVARTKPENFSKNQSNDLGFIFRGKSEADIKAYFAQVNPEELQAFHNNLQKTAAFFVGDSTYFRTNLMQSWLGDKDFGLGEKILKAINERLANSDFLNSSNSKDEININSSVIFTEQNEIDWNEALTKKQISDDANPVTKMFLEIKQAVTNSAKLNRYNDTIDEVKINDQLTQDVKAAFTEQAEAHLNSGEIFITKQTNKDFDRADFCFSNNGKETVFKGGKKGGKGEKLAAQDAITEWVKHNTKGCTSEEQTKIKTLITAAVAIGCQTSFATIINNFKEQEKMTLLGHDSHGNPRKESLVYEIKLTENNEVEITATNRQYGFDEIYIMPSESEPQEIACDPKNSEYIIQFKAKLSLEDGVVVPKIQTASHELKYTPKV